MLGGKPFCTFSVYLHTMTTDIRTQPLRIAVVGGGAAGFFAAITAKEFNPSAEIVVLEAGPNPLAKVALTGGGRCNITNSFDDVTDLKQVYPRGFRLMKRLFNEFNHKNTVEWFERRGLPLFTQPDGRLFPRSQSALSVVQCLTDTAHKLGIKVECRYRLTGIVPTEEQMFTLSFAEQKPRTFHRVILALGGSPGGRHASLLTPLKHSMAAPVPALFSFAIADKALCNLMGTAVPQALVRIPQTSLQSAGPLLITHRGMSGPAILRLSSHAARQLHEQKYRFSIAVNWVGQSAHDTIQQQLRNMAGLHARKQLSSLPPFGLPARLWEYLHNKVGIKNNMRWADLGKKAFNQLTEVLANDVYTVTGRAVFKDEFVTCGGVPLSEVNPATLESKCCKSLFFAGEMLDVDALTGGFNLQAAWTTGFTAGRAAAER